MGTTRKVYRVSELTAEIQALLEERFAFVWLEGEISNFSAPASGHHYMSLKDDKAQIRAVMFRMQARNQRFRPDNGLKVVAQGRLGVYAPRGEYQIILDYLEPLGVGALALAFERLKEKLASEGLFDADRKRPIPTLPRRVAVITLPTGAAIRDFLKVVHRRFANLEVTVVPVRVQGDGAGEEMVRALELVNEQVPADVIVLARGGGSIEDLAAFNLEILARAIRRSRIPVVSAVGHEIDVTIADLVADLRAPTPSAAAELLVAEKETLERHLADWKGRLLAALRKRIAMERRSLGQTAARLRDPRRRLGDNWLRLDELQLRVTRQGRAQVRAALTRLQAEKRALLHKTPAVLITAGKKRLDFCHRSLQRAFLERMANRRHALRLLEKRLEDLNPQAVLRRGYSITRKIPEQAVLRDSTGVQIRDRVEIQLASGALRCRVDGVLPGHEPSPAPEPAGTN